MNISLFSRTPSVTVLDNRGLPVGNIAYHRHPDTPDKTDERITRHQYDVRGLLMQSVDPRLHQVGLVNFTRLTDLVGNTLHTVSSDAGISVDLKDAAGRPFIEVSNISPDGSGQSVTRSWQYEDAALPGRQLSVTEQISGEAERVIERVVYAGNTDAEKALNLVGQGVSNYDTAGRVQTDSISLSGVPLSITRLLLKDSDYPNVVADWQGDDASAWNDALDGEANITLTTADACGAVLTTTDAKGNIQRVAYDVAGMLSGSWLTLKGGKEQVIISMMTWSAAGHRLREVHGNGVVTSYQYEGQTQRLTGIKTERPAGHVTGKKVLQDLRYQYDPIGNVLCVKNDAEETRFWRNQKVVPENTYVYDSLYQLVSASGREMANAGQQTGSLPAVSSFDNALYTHYTRSYRYDQAGNLSRIRHAAPATKNNYTTDITISNRSNRGVLSALTEDPDDVDALFTLGGQQIQLQSGQNLTWTPRNELLRVTLAVRDGAVDDAETYRYDGSSQRVLKISNQKTNNNTQTQRVLYLPGLEQRTTANGSSITESLQVITLSEAGRAQVRVLRWESGRPADIRNDQVRWSYDNLIGSSGLEVDDDGSIISQEEYYPYGGTALLMARSAVEADYKTIRYSGKERDATGLYYYGYRYYQPWVGRWLSADPAGRVDGLNLFRMCRNNPVTLRDGNGLAPQKALYTTRLEDALYTSAEKQAEIYFNSVMKPKIISRFEDDKQSALKNITLRTGGAGQELGEKYDALYQTLTSGELTFNFHPRSLKMMKGDRLLNSWQTGGRTGEAYLQTRDLAEMEIYLSGGDISTEYLEIFNHPELPEHAAGRPKYGSLAIGESKSGGAPHYGVGTMFLNEELKQYVTYTAMDSMEQVHHSSDRSISNAVAIEQNLNPILSEMKRNQLNALLDKKSPESYIEWQSHTPVLFSDVKKIRANHPTLDLTSKIAFLRFSKNNKSQWMDKPNVRKNRNCVLI